MKEFLKILEIHKPRQTDLNQVCSMEHNLPIKLWVKEEGTQRSGSSKGRVAHRLLRHALLNKNINRNSTIVETSSGNMAIALAFFALQMNLTLKCITDKRITIANRRILLGFGNCDIEEVPMDDNKNRVPSVLEYLRENARAYWPQQYTNRQVPYAYSSVVDELVQQCPRLEYLVIPVSTGGTAKGIIMRAKKKMPNLKVILVDAVGSSTLGISTPGERTVPGFGSSLRSEFVQPSKANNSVLVSDAQAIEGTKLLLQRGFLCGISTGAAFSAVLDLIGKGIPKGSKTAIFSPDSGERYLDTIVPDQMR